MKSNIFETLFIINKKNHFRKFAGLFYDIRTPEICQKRFCYHNLYIIS